MTRILLTAFEAFGDWPTNSSRLCLEAFRAVWTPQRQAVAAIEYRVYPVDFDRVRALIEADLRGGFDYAIHLGQAAESSTIRLERFALNVGLEAGMPSWRHEGLEADGPAAYETTLPVAAWAERLRDVGLPVEVSFHAGTYLCNALYYWSHFFSRRGGYKTETVFVHLPLVPGQTVWTGGGGPNAGETAGLAMPDGEASGSLEPEQTAQAIRLIVEALVERERMGQNV